MVLTAAASAVYRDVPAGHWAAQNISDASAAGFISGYADGTFGMGRTLTRGEFASMLTRLMNWQETPPANEAVFADVSSKDWYYQAVWLAAKHGAVDQGGNFRPQDRITREEMAVMLVRSLGYEPLRKPAEEMPLPFTDVTRSANRGYITIAYDFGVIAGKTNTMFDPAGTAKREEAAAMMMRLYDKYTDKTEWLHGFYALSSWKQRALGAQMDGVSFGWSRLSYSPDRGAWLNTTAEGGNDWKFPSGWQDATGAMAGQQRNLAVTMTDQTAANKILTDPAQRAQAVRAIAEQIDGTHFSGVTLDFEGMKGAALRDGLTAFTKELRGVLGAKAPIYVCVHPRLLHGGSSFDAYDYRALGDIADRVILMAHDYAAAQMDAHLMEAGFTTTPVTPFDEVYYALRCATDKNTGVRDIGKLVLGVSTTNTAGWQVKNGKVQNKTAIHPSMETVQKRLAQPDSVISWSDKYRNPYVTYRDDAGNRTVLWYENGRSIAQKINLAQMFGVDAVSVWRLGAIPTEGAAASWDAIRNS